MILKAGEMRALPNTQDLHDGCCVARSSLGSLGDGTINGVGTAFLAESTDSTPCVICGWTYDLRLNESQEDFFGASPATEILWVRPS